MIRITLRGTGGELDCAIVATPEAINEAIILLANTCVFSCGDSITIDEITAVIQPEAKRGSDMRQIFEDGDNTHRYPRER